MIRGRDIIFISSIEWGFVWQHHQEIARRLANAGNRVLYVENTGIRAPRVRDLGRVARRLLHSGRSLGSGGARREALNLHIYSPLVLPPFGPPWQRALNRRLFLPRIAAAAARLGMRDPIVWTYLPTDTAFDLISILRTPKSAVIYYCLADFDVFAPDRDQLRRTEAELIHACDLVYANCDALAERFRALGKETHLFAPGVDLNAFPANALAPGAPLPPDLAGLPHPMIGFVGGLHRFVDFELISAMARARPEWSWVLVGPRQAPVGDLALLANVHLIGQKPHDELASYIRAFDACIIPYLDIPKTATILPVKLNEYLAMGKPVVSTPLPPVQSFEREHHILYLAPPEPKLFLAAIERALFDSGTPGPGPGDMETKVRRRRVAELASWDLRLEQMSQLIDLL